MILVSPEAHWSGMRQAPPSALPAAVQARGTAAAVLSELWRRFSDPDTGTLDALIAAHERLDMSLVVTEPELVAVAEPGADLAALYRAYVAAPGRARSGHRTKAVLIGRAAREFDRRGIDYDLEPRINGFLFDGVVKNGQDRLVFEVVTFATGRTGTWRPIEAEVGNFLFACRHVAIPGLMSIEPPVALTSEAGAAFDRVTHWAAAEQIQTCRPDELPDRAAAALATE